MSERHYQVFKPRGLFYRVSELDGAKFCSFPTVARENPNTPEGEWYCENPECVVRECRVHCKLYGEELPAMHCPACAEAMKFHHWIGHKTLVPVREGPCAEAMDAAEPPSASGETVSP
jgi:hypothetical protein